MTDDEAVELFAGVGGPEPLPDDLRADLVDSLIVAARLADAGSARPVPVHLRHRLLNRRPRRLPAAWAPMQLAAAAAAVVVLASGVAVAALRGGGDGDRRPVAAAPTTTAVPSTPTTVGPEDVAAAPTTTTEPLPPATTTTTAARPKPPSKPSPATVTLAAAADCDALLAGVRAEALSRTTAYGVSGTSRGELVFARDEATAAPAAAEGAGGPSGGGDEGASQTNVQEVGVDEPDTVKTDGRLLLTTAPGGKLRVFRVTPTDITPVSELDLPGAFELFLAGDRAIVLGGVPSRDGGQDSFHTWWTEVTIVDLADPSRPRVLVRHLAEGSLESARLVDGVARVVVTARARGPVTTYPRDGSPEEQQRALAENRRAVEQSSLDDWVPQYVVEDLRGAEPARRQSRLCACEDALVPADLVGLSTVAVLTLDPQRPEASGTASTVGSGDTVYASARNLYVSNRAFDTNERTNIHRFSLADRATATYTGSGSVRGSVLNQFAFSEHEGVLRVATTDGAESFVTTIDPAPKVFGQIGQVGGLGPGERIQAVRFLGPLAYVVTFRRTDPLYVVDVSDPARPAVRGELKVNGFSAYLHPLAGDRLLGVGYEGDDDGGITGLATSLFDVADPASPTRIAHRTYPGRGTVMADWDHHAFLHWVPDGMIVLPAMVDDFRGALVLRESGRELTDVGRVSHMGRGARSGDHIDRALVLGDRLVTIGPGGLLVSDRGTLADRAWFGFAAG